MKHTVNEIQLKNGAKGLFIDVPGATVMVYELNFVAGDFLSPEGKWDTAHLMEHLVLGANEKIKSGRLYNAELEKNGAYTNAYTSSDFITYLAECADFEWQRIFDLLLIGISKPLFLRNEYKAEYGNVKDELTAYTNNHFNHLINELWQKQGLEACTDRERLKELKNIRRIDVVNHYKKTHTTSNMRFIIAGNLRGRRAALERMLEGVQLPRGRGRVALPNEKPHNLDSPLYVARPSVKNTHFYLPTFALERLNDDSLDALVLVNNMLTATLHSRILGEARERGLVYSLNSYVSISAGFSHWIFATQILPRNAQALFEIIIKELKRAQKGDISDADMDAAKQYMLGRYQRSGQTVGGVVGGYSNRYYFDDFITDYEGRPDRIKAITKKRAVDSVNRMFSDCIGGLGLLGNGKTRELADPLFESIQQLWR